MGVKAIQKMRHRQKADPNAYLALASRLTLNSIKPKVLASIQLTLSRRDSLPLQLTQIHKKHHHSYRPTLNSVGDAMYDVNQSVFAGHQGLTDDNLQSLSHYFQPIKLVDLDRDKQYLTLSYHAQYIPIGYRLTCTGLRTYGPPNCQQMMQVITKFALIANKLKIIYLSPFFYFYEYLFRGVFVLRFFLDCQHALVRVGLRGFAI